MAGQFTYTTPAITLTQLGAQSILNNAGSGRVICAIGTAPSGPDLPLVCTASQAVQIYGDPANPSTVGYSLPLMISLASRQKQPIGSAQPPVFLVCRAGVTRATGNVPGTSGTAFSVVGVGAFAGSRGNNLRVEINLTSSVITSIVVYEYTNNTYVVKQVFSSSNFDLTSSQSIANAINGANPPNSQVAIINVTNPSLTSTAIAATGVGTNQVDTLAIGGGTASAGTFTLSYSAQTTAAINWNDSPAIVQTKLSALSNVGVGNVTVTGGTNLPTGTYTITFVGSLGGAPQTLTIGTSTLTGSGTPVAAITQATAGVAPSFTISGGVDGKGTAATDASIPSLLTASLLQSANYLITGWDANAVASVVSSHVTSAYGQNQFREAVLGPAVGTTIATLTGSYNTFASGRVICIGHDGAYGFDPVTNIQRVFDGYYLAAAVCGLKAIGPVAETAVGMQVAGFGQLAFPAGFAVPITKAQQDSLAAAQFLVLNPQMTIRDSLTTAPYFSAGSINPYYQWNVQDIDDAVAYAVSFAVAKFLGRPSPPAATLTSQMQTAVMQALGNLGDNINGVNSVDVVINPSTLIPTVYVSYVTRFPITGINIQTSFTFI